MLDASQLRTVSIRQPDGTWEFSSTVALEPGDVFRMWEPGGAPVADAEGRTLFRCTKPPMVHCEPVDV